MNARTLITTAGTRLAAALALSIAATAAADPINDPDNVAWASVRGLTSEQFAQKWEQYKNAGYRVIDLEVDEINGVAQYAGVFQHNTDNRGWASLRNLTSSQFAERWEHYRNLGYRLIDQESYVLGGTRYYAGVWMENVENLKWASYRNATSAEFSDLFQTYSKAGYRMIDTEAYTVGSETRYAAVWVENRENLPWAALRDMTETVYAQKFQEYQQAGFRVLDIESYQINGRQHYAAIWVKNTNGRGWFARRDMNATWFANYWKTYRDMGYRLTDFELYETPAGPRYAGVWRQNGDRASWPCRREVDATIQAHKDINQVPGMTVVIAQDGQIKYARGFGFRDEANQLVAASDTIYRLASVSKPVSGVLAMKLAENGQYNLDQATRAVLPELPAHHTHDIRHLFNHQSGVRHYISNDPVNNNQNWNTARTAMSLFTGDPLLFNPGTDTNYSTHAFTIAAAAMEARTGLAFPRILSSRLTGPYGLSTLQCEDRTDGNNNRAKLYNSNNVEVAADNLSWKWAGGGMESDAVDLTRLGMKLLDGSILSAPSLQEMWTRSKLNSGVSTGTGVAWGVTTFLGRPLVGHSGAQTGAASYWLILPEDNLSVVVLSNRRGHDTRGLARDLAELVLKCSPPPPPPCYADCNGDGTLNFFDFLCFQNAFLAADPYADCNGDGTLNFFDFLCFQNEFLAGCR